MKKFTLCLTIFLIVSSPFFGGSAVNYYLNNFKKGKKLIVLDAGHGGHDGGTHGKLYNEKDLTLQMTLKLGEYITSNFPDIEVVYTRKTDVFLPLYQRINIANKKKADLFISIHCNYIGSPKTKGTETFVMGLHRAAENLAVAQRENDVILMENDYENNYEGYDPNSPVGHIVLSSFQDAYLDQSLAFASNVEKNFNNLGMTFSRGVKQAGFAVLRRATMPSALIETGFLSNEEEELRLGSHEGQMQIVRSIGDAIAGFFNQEKTSIVKEDKIKEIEKDDVVVNAKENVNPTKGNYRLQVVALKSEIDKKDFNHLKEIGELHVLTQNGYYKYQLGNFNTKKEAEEARAKVAKLGYGGAFVVAL